jgi:hypothetical protein
MAAVKRYTQFLEENRTFQSRWTEEYFVFSVKDAAFCYVCKKNFSVLKEYDITKRSLNHN